MGYLDAAPSLLFEEHIFRLHITMNDFISSKCIETLEKRVSKFAN